MKNFADFKENLDLGLIAYEARQKAIREADEKSDDESWDLFVREGTMAYFTMDVLRRYHEWLSN